MEKNYTFKDALKRTGFRLAITSIVYYYFRFSIAGSDGLFSFKYLFIDTIGYLICLGFYIFFIYTGFKEYKENVDKYSRKSGLKFGAYTLAFSKILSTPVISILFSTILSMPGTSVTIIGLPIYFIGGLIIGGAVGFTSELLLKVTGS